MKTPRTDAAKFRIGDSDHFAVHVAYVEQLERELAAMTALADSLAEALDNCASQLGSWHGLYDSQVGSDDVCQMLDAEKALAAYYNHKTQTP